MNILVLGNGFDLAHGLPTKYRDFLDFVEAIKQVLNAKGKEINNIDWKDIHVQIKELIKSNVFSREQEWKDLLEENCWIEYFLQCPMYQKENWIDFESEISRVIRIIESDMKKNNAGENSIVRNIGEEYFSTYFLDDIEKRELARDMKGYRSVQGMKLNIKEESEYIRKYQEEHPIESQKPDITYRGLICRLEEDLNKLIRALELYFCDYISRVKVDVMDSSLEELKIDRVLSFNYTNTFEKLYDKDKVIGYDYIHGVADIENTIETNNMVLGIDEYLSDDRKDKDIEFIAFKKFYQRIHKGTGCKYKDWIYEIKQSYEKYLRNIGVNYRWGYSENSFFQYRSQVPAYEIVQHGGNIHKLYIFGHSLDVTDQDILRDLILNDNVYTTIFYYERKDENGKSDNGRVDLGQKIANLVKVIGPDELIRKTGGSLRTIEFKKQADMVYKQ